MKKQKLRLTATGRHLVERTASEKFGGLDGSTCALTSWEQLPNDAIRCTFENANGGFTVTLGKSLYTLVDA